jgi:hypothetical protein
MSEILKRLFQPMPWRQALLAGAIAFLAIWAIQILT